MKNNTLTLIVFVLAVCIVPSKAFPLGDPPDLEIRVNTKERVYRLGNDPIKITLLVSAGSSDFITRKDFKMHDFQRMLHFTYDDGNVVTADKKREKPGVVTGDPPPLPRQAVKRNKAILIGETEKIRGFSGPDDDEGWSKRINIGSAAAHYPLDRVGKMTISMKIPGVTYRENISPDTDLVELCTDPDRTDCWHGTFKSVNNPRICLVEDADRDGYYFPCPYGDHNEIDCDDANDSVNPGEGNCEP